MAQILKYAYFGECRKMKCGTNLKMYAKYSQQH